MKTDVGSSTNESREVYRYISNSNQVINNEDHDRAVLRSLWNVL